MIEPEAIDPQHAATSLSAGSIYHMMEAMKTVRRPGNEGQWDQFQSQRPLSWKTGTSYGHRDAWAVGVNAKYVIGVWVGNADGEGRSGLIGIEAAAPALFDVVNRLDGHKEFSVPHDDLEEVHVCSRSGYVTSTACRHSKSVLVKQAHRENLVCPYHEIHYLNELGDRVLRDCVGADSLIDSSFFVLPPEMAHYYAPQNPGYQTLPKVSKECQDLIEERTISLLYPHSHSSIYLPVNEAGEKESAVLLASHMRNDATIYWHLDEEFLGATTGKHTLALQAEPGDYTLTLIDQAGYRLSRKVSVIY